MLVLEHSEGCSDTAVYHRSTPESVLLLFSRVLLAGALGRLCWYSRVLQEHLGGCVGTAEYYRSTGEAVLVQ